jgi:hypothetical protein
MSWRVYGKLPQQYIEKKVADSGSGRFTYGKESCGTIDRQIYASGAVSEWWRRNTVTFKCLSSGATRTVESDRWRCQLLPSERRGSGRGLRDRRLTWLFLKVDTDYERRCKSPGRKLSELHYVTAASKIILVQSQSYRMLEHSTLLCSVGPCWVVQCEQQIVFLFKRHVTMFEERQAGFYRCLSLTPSNYKQWCHCSF